jgi:hypothetical protein
VRVNTPKNLKKIKKTKGKPLKNTKSEGKMRILFIKNTKKGISE